MSADPGELHNLISDPAAADLPHVEVTEAFFQQIRYSAEGYEVPWRRF